MKTLIFTLLSIIFSTTMLATTVTVHSSSTGYATSSTKVAGTITVSNGTNRGYAVFNLAASGIPAAATITNVNLVFSYTISGASGSVTQKVFGYAGDISALAASSLYTAAVTTNTLYSTGWGTSATTKTMNSTPAADTFVRDNLTNNVSLTWVETGSTYIYTIAGGTSPELVITYNCPTPSGVSITSSANPVCSGASETLTGHATNGVSYSWSGPNGFTSTALTPAAIPVSTLSAGVYTFTATSTCAISTSATLNLNVRTAPSATIGANSLCLGATTILTNTGIGGTWSSSNTARATVGATTGNVSAVSAGAVNISYTTGCGSAAVFAMTMRGTPAAITGTRTVCVGITSPLSDATTGGIWTSSNTAIASINSSTGVLTGVGNGTATITYNNLGCGTATATATVGTRPSPISGSSIICTGLTTTFTDTTSGGTWTSSSTAHASVSSLTGVVTAVAAGSATITYSTGCGIIATYPLTVNASPAAILGTPYVCNGSTVSYTDATTGGTWSSSNTSLATVSATGVTYGVTQGVLTISYTKAGCSSLKSVTVKTNPGAISGATNICTGNSVTLTNPALYGNWSSTTTGVATVDPVTGVVTGTSAGSSIIVYTTGCGTNALKTEYVVSTPAAITGTTNICQATTSTLHETTTGGVWSSSAPAIASVSSAGMLSGISQGNATITYSLAGCYVTTGSTIIGIPAPISGANGICNGSSSAYVDTIYSGTWSSSNTAVATVDSVGNATSTGLGTTTITYSTGCGTAAVKTIEVDGTPTTVSGPASVCTGSPATFTADVAGGSWSSSNTSLATVNASTGLVSGLLLGTDTISYALTNGCGSFLLNRSVAIMQIGVWQGTSSMNWNDAANWPCGDVPTVATNVVIPAGTAYLPDFSAATFSVNSFTVNAGAHISISGDAIIDVKGSFTNNGIIDGDGVVNLSNSSNTQTIYGKGNTGNLTINNINGVSVNTGDSLNITGNLNLGAGVFNTNGAVTLVSNALYSGRIAPVTGGSISGNVNIQQYFQGGRRAFRFFGHPFSTAITLSQLENYIDITGAGGAVNGFTQTTTNSPSCFWYHTALGNPADPYDPGWQPFTSTYYTADSNEFKQFEGVRLFIRGAKGEGLNGYPYTPSATTVTITGEVNFGNQTVTMHKAINSDYNQLSNPYPSPTDIGTVIANAQAAGNVTGAAFYVWNPFLGSSGAFEAKPIGMPYVLGQNSAFQVRAAREGATLNFSENNKSTAADESLLKTAPENYITLGVYDGNNHLWDKAYFSFNNNATNNEDAQYDATKPTNPDLNFYSISANNVKLCIDARPYTTGTVIPLGFTTSYAQKYTIKAENVVLPVGAQLFLHDKFTNSYIALEPGASYSFTISSDPASQGEKRFELTTTGEKVVAAATKELQITMSPNPATSEINISFTSPEVANTKVNVLSASGVSVLNRDLGLVQSGKVTVDLNELPSGIYMVEITSGSEKSVQKLVKG